MSSSKWLVLILVIALIVLTFFMVKEYNIFAPMPVHSGRTVEQMSMDCQDVVLNDNTTYTGADGQKKTFNKPEANSNDMQVYLNKIESKGKTSAQNTTVELKKPLGNYGDNPIRAIPNQIMPNDINNTPEMCAKKATELGYPVAGIQWYGECWAGKNIDDARKYGKSPYNNPNKPDDFKLGRGWNNLVMADVGTSKCTIPEYSSYVSELLGQGITDYKNVQTFVGSMEGFREGAKPQSAIPQQDPKTSPVVGSGVTNQSVEKSLPISTDNFFILKTSVGSFLDEARKSGVTPTQFANQISKENFTTRENMTSNDVVEIREKLTSIGLRKDADLLNAIDNLYTSIGVTSEKILDPQFTKPYTDFGLSESNHKLHVLIEFAQFVGVSEKKDSEFNMVSLVSILKSNGITVDNIHKLYNQLDNFYSIKNGTFSDFQKFLSDVNQFNTGNSGNLNDKIENMKTELAKYQIETYSNYRNLKYKFKSSTSNNIKFTSSANPDIKFLQEFYKYYTVTNPHWFKENLPNNVTFNSALDAFMDEIKRQIGNNAAPQEIDLYRLVIPLNQINVNVGNITQTNLGKRTVEPFTNKYVEPMKGITKQVNTLADALTTIGVKDSDKIQVSLAYQPMTESVFNSYLKWKLPDITEPAKINLLTWFASLGMVDYEINELFFYLENIGINSYAYLNELKGYLDQVNLVNFTNIKPFLQLLGNFGVSYSQFGNFFKELELLHMSLSDTDSRDKAYTFLNTLIKYNITYTKSSYDICNTKFSNFVKNMVSDNVTIEMRDIIIFPMLRMLNNGIEPSTPPKTPEEKQKLDQNMRDVIILREKSIYTGNSLDDSGFLKCNNQFTFPKDNGTQNPMFKDDQTKVYALAGTNRQAGTAPPFLYERNKQGEESPTILVNGVPTDPLPTLFKNLFYYAGVALNGSNQSNPRLAEYVYKTPPFEYKSIVSNLTNYEYNQLKNSTHNLVVSSVMSRLYAKLVSSAMNDLQLQNYTAYNSKLDTINYIRILPYYMFRLIETEIKNNTKDGKSMYDMDNDPNFRNFVPGVEPYYPETFIRDSAPYTQNASGGFM